MTDRLDRSVVEDSHDVEVLFNQKIKAVRDSISLQLDLSLSKVKEDIMEKVREKTETNLLLNSQIHERD